MAEPHKAAALLMAAVRVDPVLRRAAEKVQDALIATDDEVERLRARVAELESGEIHVDWGVQLADGSTWQTVTEAGARLQAAVDGRPAMRRESRIGPWKELTS